MSAQGETAGFLPPPLPTSIWVLAYASVASQLVALLRQGGNDGDGTSLAVVDDLREAVLHLLALATTVVSLGALAKFRRTPWYAWQRTKPPRREGAPIVQLVAIGVFVGVLGGFVGPVDTTIDVELRVSAHQSPHP